MKNRLAICLYAAFLLIASSTNAQLKTNQKTLSPFGFLENKGQLTDQHGNARPDVLFSCTTRDLAYYLRSTGISYQLNKVDTWKEETPQQGATDFFVEHKRVPDQVSIYRLDLEWLNTNTYATVETDEALPGYSNYYLAICPDGIRNVKTFSGLTYKNIYPDIDLHYYTIAGNLKYDYLVAPYADYRQIRIKVHGATSVSLQNDGSLLFKTPLGEIKEAAPVVYQGKKKLNAKWSLRKNELSFSIQNYDPALPLTIDPLVRTWGTYIGGGLADEGRACATDVNSNVYTTGKTNSTAGIASTGAFKTTISSGSDAFLLKFNSAGVKQWGTYYGGNDNDYANACATDASGNIYIAGQTGPFSSTGIASGATAHHGFNAGGTWDAFLAKFDATGARLWGTYYGGTGFDIAEGLATDPSGNIFMSGYSTTIPGGFTSVVTPGAHQTVFGSAILVKFNSNGTRLWGTYYGDSQYSHGNACATDAAGNVFMAGSTDAQNLISTPGAHQLSQIGMQDGFLVKFNSAGVRQWGTYYGDVSLESVWSCAVDPSGNVYIAGSSGSPTGIATPGAHQSVIGMQFNGDGILVKFDGAGVRQWGTYYGGNTDDLLRSCIVAPNGDVYVAGLSHSPNNIASANSYQAAFAGGPLDAIMARFTQAGVQVWGSYFGGSGDEFAYGCAADANGNFYLAGYSSSTGTDITSVGHQTIMAGAPDAFLVQFNECTAPGNPVNTTPASNTTACSGHSATLSATASGTISWYSSVSGGSSLGSGSVFNTPPLSPGTNTFFAETTSTCGISNSRTPVVVTAVASPPTQITTSSPGICAGGTATLTASGADQYLWVNSSNSISISVTPANTSTYMVNGTSLSSGCSASAAITITVFANPSVTITSLAQICAGQPATLVATGASQYTWGPSQTGSVLVVTPQSPNSYSVTGKSPEGCVGSATVSFLVNACLGLEELGNVSIHIFPNPFKETVQLQLPVYPAGIILTDVTGKLLLQKTVTTENTSLDLKNYTKGLYILSVKYGDVKRDFKVVKD